MCGIAGICTIHNTPTEDLARQLDRMSLRLVHRGPDEAGEFVEPHIALGSRRLKIIDLMGGRMPISNETGSVQVVYNGEIYNFRRLREELQAKSHRFSTHTDTEVLAHLYEDYAFELVHQLQGMFAFAIWDAKAAMLVLARDRLGIKPLFYRVHNGTIWFASELKSLVMVATETPEVDPEGVADYLALGYIRDPRTIYRGYRKLQPGTVLCFRGGVAETRKYWDFPATEPDWSGSEDEALARLDDQLRQSVGDRLVADVPVGSFLSGGVDSSVVTALAAQQTSGRLKTFTIGFAGNDERKYARRVAQEYGTDHHELVLEPKDCRISEKLLDYFDEPFGDSSAIPTYFVSKLAREHVTVALSGDGGDELFGGYDQYDYDRRWAWLDWVPRPLRMALFEGPTRLLPAGVYGWNRLRALAATREGRFSLHRTEELHRRRGGVAARWIAEAAPRSEEFFAEEFRAARMRGTARLLYVDSITYLPGDILTKVDRMSMAHSLEVRVPLLDHRVVELVASFPTSWKLRGRERKRILKRLAERYVPREILSRPKRGFSLPIRDWLRAELAGRLDALAEPNALAAHYLHRPTLLRLIAEHRQGRRDHCDILWRLLILAAWLCHREGGDLGPFVETGSYASNHRGY